MKRVKRRYLALQVECENIPTEREFIDSVWAVITKLYGEVGASLSGLTLIDFDLDRKLFVVRVLLTALDMVKASLATITSLEGKEASVNVLSISGTLKALHSKVK